MDVYVSMCDVCGGGHSLYPHSHAGNLSLPPFTNHSQPLNLATKAATQQRRAITVTPAGSTKQTKQTKYPLTPLPRSPLFVPTHYSHGRNQRQPMDGAN